MNASNTVLVLITGNFIMYRFCEETFVNINVEVFEYSTSSQSSHFKHSLKWLLFEHQMSGFPWSLWFCPLCLKWALGMEMGISSRSGFVHSLISYLSRSSAQLHYKMKVTKICNVYGDGYLFDKGFVSVFILQCCQFTNHWNKRM